MVDEGKKISKTIRFPKVLVDCIEECTSKEDINFSEAVIELVEKGHIIIVTEGSDIVKYLFEIKRLLQNPELDNETRESVNSVLEKLTDTIVNIQDKYM